MQPNVHAATLSESRGRGAWFDSLIAAHEFVTQLLARRVWHDGTGSCGYHFFQQLPHADRSLPAAINSSPCSLLTSSLSAHAKPQAVCLRYRWAISPIAPDLAGTWHASVDQQFKWTLAATNRGAANLSGARNCRYPCPLLCESLPCKQTAALAAKAPVSSHMRFRYASAARYSLKRRA